MIRDGHFVPVSPALACRGTSEEEGQGALLLLPSESPWTGLVLRPRGVRGRPPSPSVSVEPRERGVGGLLFVVGLVLLERFPHYYFFPLPPPPPPSIDCSFVSKILSFPHQKTRLLPGPSRWRGMNEKSEKKKRAPPFLSRAVESSTLCF